MGRPVGGDRPVLEPVGGVDHDVRPYPGDQVAHRDPVAEVERTRHHPRQSTPWWTVPTTLPRRDRLPAHLAAEMPAGPHDEQRHPPLPREHDVPATTSVAGTSDRCDRRPRQGGARWISWVLHRGRGAGGAGVRRRAGGLGLASMPASRRCCAVIGVGAPVSGSKPPPVFGNAMTSRIESRAGEQHADPVPAEGDAAVRRRAVLERLQQEAELVLRLLRRRCRAGRRPAAARRRGGYGSSRRRSRCRCRRCRTRRPAPGPGASSKRSTHSAFGEVNGWCTAVQPPVVSVCSNIGASTTQQNAQARLVDQAGTAWRSRCGPRRAAPAPRGARWRRRRRSRRRAWRRPRRPARPGAPRRGSWRPGRAASPVSASSTT